MLFSANLTSIVFLARSLNKLYFDDSYRPNKVVQINELTAFNRAKVI